MRIELNGLLQLLFRRDVLHLMKGDLPQQPMRAGIFSVLLKHGLGLLAGAGVLSRRNEQISEL